MFNETSPLDMAQQIAAVINSTSSASLSEYTKSTRLAPVVLIDDRVLMLEPTVIEGMLQALLSVYCGHYLTAVNMTMQVGNVKVGRILDQFGTDRSVIGAAGNSIWWSAESADSDSHDLPVFSLETSYSAKLDGATKPVLNDKVIHTITDETKLVCGKILDVPLTNGDKTTIMPVQAVLYPKSIAHEDLVTISKANGADNSMYVRYHQWRSGEIKSFTDYLFALDQIELNMKAKLADKTGTMLNSANRGNKGFLATLLSGYASPNRVSTMTIMSSQTAKEVELAIRGTFKSIKTRESYFENNSSMMLVVVDTRMERFTLYQRGIPDYAEYTLESVKGASKKPGAVDIDAVMRAYSQGMAAKL